ncbi:pleckstrin homology domain-containing family A member 5-like [Ailuropoda melanoleuca]|uniref:pleckstrin homology domain-containing family A member 5-like n=1 Tax=Ailuropoda melanoleuca TaxID=9646 RepID=UPI001493FDD6|nr:pleckstrin homology domain-containing family A member 5-like [Ailuropoda melanoleuca]
MAADLNLEWICSLPRSWTYGITRGGRVFFINEEAKSTTWLHPVTGEAVVTGHRRQSTGNAEPGRARAELGSAGRRRQSSGRPPPRNLPPAAVPGRRRGGAEAGGGGRR